MLKEDNHFSSDLTSSPNPNELLLIEPTFAPSMSCYSASAFTQSAPQVSSDSFYLDEIIHVAANTCTGVQHHVAEITAFLIKELGYSVFAKGKDPLPFFISRIVNETTQDVRDIGGVISAAHILLMSLCESDRFDGAAWSGHQLFLSAFAFAAREQSTPRAAVYIHSYAFWSKLSKFTVREVKGMQDCLFDELQGRVWVFREAMEKVEQTRFMKLQAQWRQEDEEIEQEKKRRSFSGRVKTFWRHHGSL